MFVFLPGACCGSERQHFRSERENSEKHELYRVRKQERTLSTERAEALFFIGNL